jgi:hypothetical protein
MVYKAIKMPSLKIHDKNIQNLKIIDKKIFWAV